MDPCFESSTTSAGLSRKPPTDAHPVKVTTPHSNHAFPITSSSVYRAAHSTQGMDMENDLVVGWRWLATLDRNTCIRCGARDGMLYDLNFQPQGHSLAWGKGPGKLHKECRCLATPELQPSFRGLRHGATRPSVCDGKAFLVSASTRYADWIKERSGGFLETVLGPTRSQVFQKHGLKLTDLLTPDGMRELRLWELTQLYPWQ